MQKPLVSVVMPTYNAEQYLNETMDSLLSQTFKNFELLIIDDASKDNTRKIIRSYKDARIKLINGPQKGLATALNYGIKIANGKYIARMDADDIALPERFAKEVEFLEKHQDISIVGTWQERFGVRTGIHQTQANHEDIKAKLLFGCDMCHSTIMLRKADIIKYKLFYDEKSPQEDFELWSRAIKKVKFANIPEVLSRYRTSNDSITAGKRKILEQYELSIIIKQLKENLSLEIAPEDQELLQRRYNPLSNKSSREQEKFLQKFDRLCKKILDSNEKIRFYNQQSLYRELKLRQNECYKQANMKSLSEIHKYWNVYQTPTHKIYSIMGIKLKFSKSLPVLSQRKSACYSYDYVIPIGSDCLTAQTLDLLHMREHSFPFDWLYIKYGYNYFETAVNCILSRFKYFWRYRDLTVTGTCPAPHNTWEILNKKTKFVHIHDYPLKDNRLLSYIKTKIKYHRREKRLLNILSKNNNILLLYMSQNPTDNQLIVSKMKELETAFPKARIDLLMLEHDATKSEKEYSYSYLDYNIKKYLYNNGYEFSPEGNQFKRNQKVYMEILRENIVFKPKISIIMPTYNAEKYLKPAVDSILNQTFKNFELLVIDDNSHDKTLKILSSYSDSRIKIIKGDNKGISAALNKGLKRAKGEYIARMDADDIALPERLQVQSEYLDKHPEIGLCSSYFQGIGSSNRQWGQDVVEPKDFYTSLLYSIPMAHPSIMFRAQEFRDKNLYYDESYKSSEDFEFFSRCIRQVKFYKIPQVLLQYRWHPKQSTYKHHDNGRSTYLRIIKRNFAQYLNIKLSGKLLDLFWGAQPLKVSASTAQQLKKSLDKIYNKIAFQPEYDAARIRKFFDERLNSMKIQQHKTKYILSISKNKKHKIVTVLGLKIKIKRNIFKKLRKIFDVKNDSTHKVWTILGLKIKFKNSKKLFMSKYDIISQEFKQIQQVNKQLINQYSQLCQEHDLLKNKLQEVKTDLFYYMLSNLEAYDTMTFRSYIGKNVEIVSAHNPQSTELMFFGHLFSHSNLTQIGKQKNVPDFYILWGQKYGWDSVYNCLKEAMLHQKPLYILEDGFLKSVASPWDKTADIKYRNNLSYTVNTNIAYFDGTKASALEKMLNNKELFITPSQRRRAKDCICQIVRNYLTKYNHQPIYTPQIGRKGVKKILVIDQSYGDMSIVKGCADDKTFQNMLECAIKENPDADIIVKTHPDTLLGAAKGYYTGIQQHDNVYPYTDAINPIALLQYCDEVYVCTSQMGFEALLCGKKVHTFGVGFYAGYGLTDDRCACPRRTVKRSLEEMFYIIYILFSYYVLPDKDGAATIEEIMQYIIRNRKIYFSENNIRNDLIIK